MYKYIIFDADHTLLEFDSDEKTALKKTFADYGYSGVTAEELQRCRNLSYEGWAQIGLNDIHKVEIQKNYHDLYQKYIYILMERLIKEYSLTATAQEAGDRFISYFSEPGHIIGGSLEVLYRLAQYYNVSIATNGLSSIQRGRLSPFDGVVSGYFISDEVGHIKPEKAFFESVLSALGAKPEECLMVGDSISSDIIGAKAAGISACWFNRFGAKSDIKPDLEIEKIEDLLPVLL